MTIDTIIIREVTGQIKPLSQLIEYLLFFGAHRRMSRGQNTVLLLLAARLATPANQEHEKSQLSSFFDNLCWREAKGCG